MTTKKASEKKPSKKEIQAAVDQGMTARKENPDQGTSCPHPEGPLRDAWFNGWKGQDEFEAKQTEGEKQLEKAGHAVGDEDVKRQRDETSMLLKILDNIGVSMVEEQLAKLDEAQQSITRKWAHRVLNREDESKCVVPEFLQQYATERLNRISAEYLRKQDEQRKIIVRCRFNKPSAILPSGDDGEDAIKMSLVIPDSDMNRASLPEDFFHGKRLRIEFSRRAVNQWDQQLPGLDTQPAIITCESDVKGFARGMTSYKFGFKIATSLIDDNTANRVYAKQDGSVRLTLLGDIEAGEQEEISTAELINQSRPNLPQGQKSLFDGTPKPMQKVDDFGLKDGEFLAPDEYLIPMILSGKGNSVIIYIGMSEGRFYSSALAVVTDEEGDEDEADWMNPCKTGDGCMSAKDAILKELGSLIDYGLEKKYSPNAMADLRNEVKRLESGGEPIKMPE